MNRAKSKLLFRLREWRDERARKSNVPTYRILPNRTLEALAETLPSTRDEILCTPGIKEAKWQQYGAELLAMIGDALETEQMGISSDEGMSTTPALGLDEKDGIWKDVSSDVRVPPQNQDSLELLREPFSVGAFLDVLNESFRGIRVPVRGEVSGIEERRGHVYFSLKDAEDGSVMSCVLFRNAAILFASELEEGSEVIVEGMPNIWKPRGRFSFQIESVRHAGEGALRRAYEALCQKLEAEGLFEVSRKRLLPNFPKRIALISSREGAALGDFMANIGRRGFHISLFDARVEGAGALPDLVHAIRFFNASPEEWDVLVVTRGGGSLESLEAFNAEALVREIAASKIPVLAAIGHEKDVPLSARVADVMVSTPTAAAKAISFGFEDAERKMLTAWERSNRQFSFWKERSYHVWEHANTLTSRAFEHLRQRRKLMERYLDQLFSQFSFSMRLIREREDRVTALVIAGMSTGIQFFSHALSGYKSRIEVMNPKRLLERGYGFFSKNGQIIRNVSQIAPGDTIDFRLIDGNGEAIVQTVKKLE